MAGNNEMDLPNCQQGLIILLAGDLKTKLKILPNGILTVMIVSRLMTTTLLCIVFTINTFTATCGLNNASFFSNSSNKKH